MQLFPSPDLADPRFFTQTAHLELWQRARREHPLQWVESDTQGPFWSVTTHALATRILEDPSTFTSTRGMRLGARPAGVAAAADRMLVVADGQAHARIRGAHAPWFTSKNVKLVGEALSGHLHALLRPLTTGEPVDIVDVLADAVPTYVMAEMLGTDLDETHELSRQVRTSFDESSGPADTQDPAEHAAASARVFAYFHKLVRARRASPGDDVVSRLMRPLADGTHLTSQELLLNCDGLVNGGLGTSRHAVSGTVEAFARHPDQWAKLRENPSLLSGAVEEVLRWACPPMHVMRTATTDVELAGKKIANGDRVVVWLPSCNRDEAVFTEPDSFRIERRPNPHLSLGAGPHYCIGAAVGRLEIRVLLQVMLARIERLELCGEAARSASSFLNGVDRLEVRMNPLSAQP
ncbi:cytochrome P450 [Micromonospora sp. DR5-3]|uniref:cytochrome P450 n=1 Tax=unclassified Micromonospora TaxID=2617518 RepID=UPI0011DBE221|nr:MULTISPECIES: cytochrome P450 [unclassified Micromonospora]MCW3815798.1 cytochrome P450 [Micromonospora sp. DR5-3]TYC21219.1 cytochrome P450 [Micromonospora sp. MP36]